MRWRKLGLLFEPSRHELATGGSEFAQSPQALVCDDRVRVYFSTRTREPDGKHLSHISFVDLDRSLKRVIGIAEKPVIGLGKLGCFDEHGIFPMNVVRYGEVVHGYTCGWSRRKSVSIETSIGLAISHDGGATFRRSGDGPILTSSLHEPCLVGDPFVTIYGTTWHMWYIYGLRWIEGSPLEGSPARVYKIGHATSSDGIDWRRDGRQLIADKLNSDECQALPTVIEIGGRNHMYFCYREATGFREDKARAYRIGHACSDDLTNWVRDDESVGIQVSEDGWDSEMQCYPHVFRRDEAVYMLYNGNGFGRQGFGVAVLEA